MQVDVYDSYARAPNGMQIHFDVLLPAGSTREARECACEWLDSIGRGGAKISLELCRYCHSENRVNPKIQRAIAREGYFILQMEGCPSPDF